MTDKLKTTTEHLMNPHGETLLHNGEVFAEFHNPYKSEHLKTQVEADELKIEAARKLLEQAPVTVEMQRRNNISHVSELAANMRAEKVLAQEKAQYDDPSLTLKDITKENYDLAR